MAPLTRKRKSLLDQSVETVEEAPTVTAAPKRQRKLPTREKNDETVEADDVAASVKGTIKVFTDEDEEAIAEAQGTTKEETTAEAMAPVTKEKEIEDSEDSDDDEAPEAISTSQAASSAKKSAQAVNKAAQEQAAVEKRKRQQRDALFKQQAEERKKQEDEEKAALAASVAKEEESSGRRHRASKVEVPDVLPAEFLEDSSSDDDDEGEDDDQSGVARPRPKKGKVSTIEGRMVRQSRDPRDEQVGSTVYRVAKKTDERLPPKSMKHSKNTKALLLKRNKPVVKSGSGFLKRK